MSDQAVEAPHQHTDRSIDLRGILALFLRRQGIFLTVAALILGATVLFTLTQTPTYTATASVLLQPQQTGVLKDEPVPGANDTNMVDTEVEVLSSRYLAKRVAVALRLDKDPEFNERISQDSGGLLGLFRSTKPATNGGERAISPSSEDLDDVTDAVQSRMRAKRNGLTYVIDVSFTAKSGEKASLIANAIAQEYILAQTEAKYDVAHGANEWVSGRVQALAREVVANEAAVQNYKVAHNLMSAQGATMAEQEVSTLNQQIAVARAELAEKEARLAAAREQISRGGGGGDVAAALDSNVVSELRRQRADISRRQAELQTRYGPLHPDVKKVERELADMDRQIQEEISRIISNLEAEVRVALQRANSLESSRGSAQGALGASNTAVVALNELQRKADASRAIYEAFLNRSKETSAQAGLQRPDARISSPAEPPTRPSSPKKAVNLALGLLLGLGGGVAAVLLAENLDGGLRTGAQVERILRIPGLGAIPLLPRSARHSAGSYVIEKPFSSVAEAFRNLRASLLFAAEGKPIQIIAVTSALPGEGKTMTATSLARSAAQSGAKVLMVDGDLRRRMLTNSLGTPPDVGLLEVLEGRASLDDALITDELSGAQLLLLSDAPPPTADIFGGDDMGKLLEQLRARFDVVVIDTAPVLAVAETRVLAARADAAVFLLRWAKTPQQAALAAVDLLLDAGAFVPGAVLTQVDLSKQAKLGYGDSLYYFGEYRKYYTE